MELAFSGTMADSLIGRAFVLWIVITMLGLLRTRQIFPGIVSIIAPTWQLFAPNPIIYNYDLAFRSKRGEGQFSPWKQLSMSYSRAWHHAIWNPGFAEQIFLFRLCQSLVELDETDRRVERLRERAYDFLLSLIAIRFGEQPETIQFMIVRCCPLTPDGAYVVFLSEDEMGADVS